MTSGTDWLVGAPDDWRDLGNRAGYVSRAQVLELAVQLARATPGNIVEFGVWQGASTRLLRAELTWSSLWEPGLRRKKIFACDSFRGLPGQYDNLAPGTFATSVPKLRGVRIVNGFFEDTLTLALAREVGQVSLAHFDADLYTSTACALEWLTPLVRPGTLLLFDEFCGDDPAEQRAFAEWCERTGVRAALLALFGRSPSGRGHTTDRRALFQVLGDREQRTAPGLLPLRLRRRLLARG